MVVYILCIQFFRIIKKVHITKIKIETLKSKALLLHCTVAGPLMFWGETWDFSFKRDNKFFKLGDFKFDYRSTIMIVWKIDKNEIKYHKNYKVFFFCYLDKYVLVSYHNFILIPQLIHTNESLSWCWHECTKKLVPYQS